MHIETQTCAFGGRQMMVSVLSLIPEWHIFFFKILGTNVILFVFQRSMVSMGGLTVGP